MTRISRGFSLVELAVALAVAGALGLVAWRLVPLALDIGDGPANRTAVLRGEQEALEGFARQQLRLPCPDADGDGHEDCSAGDRGTLPWATLGISRPASPVRYAVHRGGQADLAVATPQRYQPHLPPGSDSDVHNGLDLCRRVLRATSGAGLHVGTGAQRTAAAYVLAHPGGDRRFGFDDGTFPLPGDHSAGDDIVIAAGAGALAGRLGCVARLPRARGSARAAYAAYDLERVAALYERFRAFAYDVRKTNVAMAEAAVALASLDLANAIGSTASAIALTALTKGVSSASIAGAVASITAAVGSLAVAGTKLGLANAALDRAETRYDNARPYHQRVRITRDRRIDTAVGTDQTGLRP
ncbi:prepilin-type N-terminal cleavage/methylation domain-containing protein [Arhodomonas sp. AD133]|uniref:prepilin-type N-terminal cleavage/methylation domain-containing protein n=1 Tax=Arhodomonas sp. AD133 TaxID=3415009 RepID=UPI003EBAD3C2